MIFYCFKILKIKKLQMLSVLFAICQRCKHNINFSSQIEYKIKLNLTSGNFTDTYCTWQQHSTIFLQPLILSVSIIVCIYAYTFHFRKVLMYCFNKKRSLFQLSLLMSIQGRYKKPIQMAIVTCKVLSLHIYQYMLSYTSAKGRES